MRAYGLPGRASEYEEDHLIALPIGGAPTDPTNLWPEPRRGFCNAGEKDQLERLAARMACARRIPLGRLQHEVATDCIALYRMSGGSVVPDAYSAGG
jgi:hypothetical protein